MPSQQLIVGNIGQGLTTNPLSFNIDNDAFPFLQNAYQWRGRVKRKRGTSFLGRLQRYFNSSSTSYNSGSTTITFDGSGNANLLTGFSLQTNGNIVPGSVNIVASGGPTTYTDPTKDGYLTPTGTGGANTINYASGAILIPGQAGNTATATFLYYPDLPVMGLEDLVLSANQFPGTLAFDTIYSYNINTTSPYSIYDVSFYKNPPAAAGPLPGYVQKTTVTPTSWNGQDYQQFWTTNYEGALWAINGINVPFSVTNIGMQYKPITTVNNITAGPPALADLTIAAHGLVVGDFVFVNEVLTTTGINLQTGYVTVVVSANKVTVEFPNATIATNGTGGIAQYLTNRSDITKDCIRWYDGDPTNGNATSPTLNGNLGWVNFAPPLSNAIYSIDDEPELQYYLVGARMIVPYKDRLLFIGPVIQTSSAGSQVYLQDTVIFSQNGTPYYTCSFTGSVTSATTVFNPILVPSGETATANAWFEDVTGFGGFRSAGLAQPLTTAGFNEDVLILGFTNRQTRFIYSGNDIQPFDFFTINSELGSSSTFSAVTLDRGVLTIGSRGIIITAQIASQRIDLQIPDQVFQFNLLNNGVQRVTAQRDFINEWIFFTYPSNMQTYKFPNQTLQYNYRDATWAIFNECYTTYGQFNRVTGQTWATLPADLTWDSWNVPWNSGSSTLLQPEIIAGNQQGFIVFRDSKNTGESNSLYIASISGSVITSPNHSLNNTDFIVISGCLGLTGINGNIYQVSAATANTFTIDANTPITGTYLGGGVVKRMYIPKIMTKQFPVAWQMSRKTRIGAQQYLFSRTANGQIELQIFLSQNEDQPYNFGPIVPQDDVLNNSLIYTDILYTCPESTNLGLTPANINLDLITAGQQDQIWHRMNTSLIGDTVQIGFTLSAAQMRDTTFSNQFAEIELHSFILSVSPSQVLA